MKHTHSLWHLQNMSTNCGEKPIKFLTVRTYIYIDSLPPYTIYIASQAIILQQHAVNVQLMGPNRRQ